MVEWFPFQPIPISTFPLVPSGFDPYKNDLRVLPLPISSFPETACPPRSSFLICSSWIQWVQECNICPPWLLLFALFQNNLGILIAKSHYLLAFLVCVLPTVLQTCIAVIAVSGAGCLRTPSYKPGERRSIVYTSMNTTFVRKVLMRTELPHGGVPTMIQPASLCASFSGVSSVCFL